jgi:carbohydrate-binding DOMON domain-containing protein
MSTQYRLVQSGKTASGGCSAGQGSSEPVAPRIYYYFIYFIISLRNIERVNISNGGELCFL